MYVGVCVTAVTAPDYSLYLLLDLFIHHSVRGTITCYIHW